MARVFVDVVTGIQLVRHVDCPWFRPRLGIVNRELIAQLVLSNAPEAFRHPRHVTEEAAGGAGLIVEIAWSSRPSFATAASGHPCCQAKFLAGRDRPREFSGRPSFLGSAREPERRA